MKRLKRFNENWRGIFIQDAPERDEDYKYIQDVCNKVVDVDGYMSFYLKELLPIGKIGNDTLYLNYISLDRYNGALSFWFMFNEHSSELYGTEWDFGVLYEEDGKLYTSDRNREKIELYPYFIKRIKDTISSYSDLDKWCEHLVDIVRIDRGYMRNKGDKTWDERLEWQKASAERERLLNRRKENFHQKDLEEMIELGEEKYNKISKERNDKMMKILDEIDFDDEEV